MNCTFKMQDFRLYIFITIKSFNFIHIQIYRYTYKTIPNREQTSGEWAKEFGVSSELKYSLYDF